MSLPISHFFGVNERDAAIIHIHPAYKHAQHYVAVALPGRLRAVIRRQSKGEGAALTRAARAAGSILIPVAIAYSADLDRINARRDRGYVKAGCPICTGCVNLSHPEHRQFWRRRAAAMLREYSHRMWERYQWEVELLAGREPPTPQYFYQEYYQRPGRKSL